MNPVQLSKKLYSQFIINPEANLSEEQMTTVIDAYRFLSVQEGWISAADRLPENHHEVLVYRQGQESAQVGYYYVGNGGGRWYVNGTDEEGNTSLGDHDADDVLYWMPFPGILPNGKDLNR